MSQPTFASALFRAVSPLNTANSFSEDDPTGSRRGRHLMYQGASSIDDLLAMVPADYRHVLRDPLIGVAATTTKLCAVRATLGKWQAHKTAGTYPPHMRVRAPEVQLSRGFGEDDKSAAHRSTLEKAHKAYLDTTLDNNICAKGDDVAFLERALEVTRLFGDISPLIAERSNNISRKSKLPVFTKRPDGDIELARWENNDIACEIGKSIVEDVPVLCFRVISLLEAREFAAAAKVVAKKQLAEQGDVEMADGGKPGPSIQSMIDKTITARLKKAPQKGGAKKVRQRLFPDLTFSNEIKEFEQQGREGEEEDGATPEEAANRSKTVSTQGRAKASQSGRRGQAQEEQGQGEAGKEIGCQSAARFLKDFKYDRPSSFPDWLLTVPLTEAISYVILNTPVDIILVSQFKNNVHIRPNVEVPTQIQHQLSVGMNYMFKRKCNSNLIKEAYNDFAGVYYSPSLMMMKKIFMIQTTRSLTNEKGNLQYCHNTLN